ncbi:phage tail tape measure protein [Clostridium perfringens]
MTGGISLAPLVTQIKVNIDGFKSQMDAAKNLGVQKAEEISRSFDKITKTGESFSKVGSKLTSHVTLPLVGLGAAAVKVGMDFEAQMDKVAAISGATGEDFKKLKAKAEEMGAKTKFSASEAGEGLEFMAMAGWKTGDMLDGIEPILNLAIASGEELGTTSDIVTDALTAFGLSAKDAGMFSDVLAAASSNANTNVGMMGETFKYAAPVAGSLGYTAKDTALAIGLMANSGIKASQAGTSLRAGLTNLVNPSKKMAKAMTKYGISLKDAHGHMKPFREVMTDLREKLGKLDKSTQAAVVSTIFGKEAMSGWLAIINASEQDFNKLSGAIDNSEGATAKMAKTMSTNAKGSIAEMKSALEESCIKVFEVLAPTITDIANKISDLANKFSSLSPETQKMIVQLALAAAATGPLMKGFGGLLTGAGKLKDGIGLLNGFFVKGGNGVSKFSKALKVGEKGAAFFGKGVKKIIDPLGLTNKAMSKTGKGATLLGKQFLKLKGPIQTVGSKLSLLKVPFTATGKVFSKFGSLAGKTGSKVIKSFGKMANLVPGPVKVMGSKVGGIFTKLGGTIVGKMASIVGSVVGGMGSSVASLIGFVGPVGIVIAIVAAMALAFATNFGGCRDTVFSVMNSIQSIISSVTAVIQIIWSNWGTYIMTFISAIWSNIEVVFRTVLNVIADVFKIFAALFKGDWQGVWNAVKDIFSNIWHMIGTLLKNFLNIIIMIIVGVGSRLLSAAKSAFMFVLHGFKSVWNMITSWLSEAVHHPVRTIRGIGSALYSAGCSIFRSLWDGIKSIWSGICSWVVDKVNWLKEKVMFWKSSSSSMNADGSHYNGLDYVPFDGYIARLHKGERVLTAEENAALASGQGRSTTINFNGTYGFNNKNDIDYFMNQAALKLKGAR